ncbi:MAG: helix-turn-helix transcriptional regulator [Clostridia bacterium]|nr:helix-turn-helix transcriptional regulator [Clostridia bacterium]
MFGKYNGLGIHEYILKNKIFLAKQMLRDGFSVTETSDKLSFSSQNYFSTAFKREVGISPGKYKINML